jgi:hypothetical protein
VTSAPAARALSKRSGRLPGTNRKERSIIETPGSGMWHGRGPPRGAQQQPSTAWQEKAR